ncbi:hypothetical protein C8R45DRAFT_937397 [Mycena sanguinolenta]|nr:hypothetical protein C8R45DRAFT_937397 [Mycena sanguinolenta]
MDQTQHILAKTSDPQLKTHFLSEVLQSSGHYHQAQWIEELIAQGISHLKQVTDPVLGWYQANSILERQFFTLSNQIYLVLSNSSGRPKNWLNHLGTVRTGDYSTAQLFATKGQQAAEVAMNLHQCAVAFHFQAHQITANLGNPLSVLQRGLWLTNNSNLEDTIFCVIYLNSFYRFTTHGHLSLMDQVQHILAKTSDPQLKTHFFSEVLQPSGHYHQTQRIEELIIQGISHFKQVTDPVLEYLPHALQFIYKAQELAKSSGDNSQQCSVLIKGAHYNITIGDYPTAQLFAIEARQIAEEAMDLYHSGLAFYLQACCARYLGNYQKSIMITLDQAEIHLLKSEYSQAQRIFRDLANMTSLNGNSLSYANALLNIAHIEIQINVPAEIVLGLNRAAEIFSTLALPIGIIACRLTQAGLELRDHNFDLAGMNFQECLHLAKGLDAEAKSFCLEHLADIKLWPATEIQSRWPMVYLSFSAKCKDKLALHKALLFLGDIFNMDNDEDTALALYTVALDQFTCMDVHQSRAQCMLHLGDFTQKHGKTTEAVAHWKTARPLFKQSSQAKDVIEIDSRLAALEKAHEEALDKLATLEAPTQLLSEVSISGKDSLKVILV